MPNLIAKTEDTSPSNDDLLYLVNNPSGTPADRKATLANVLGTGLAAVRALTPAPDKFWYFTSGVAAALADLTTQGRDILALTTPDGLRDLQGVNDWRLLPVTKTANYTAAAGDLVLCYAGSSFTVTLPSSSPGIMPPRIAVKLATAFGASKVTVARPSGGGTINGAAADIDLFMAGDYLWLTNTAPSEWHVIAERLQPHCGILEAAAATTIPASTWTKINLDTTTKDTCGLADLANDRITVRRAGVYDVIGYGWLDLGGSGIAAGPGLKKNGTFIRQHQQDAGSQACNGLVVMSTELAAGDYIDLWYLHLLGTSRTTQTNTSLRPMLSVAERR